MRDHGHASSAGHGGKRSVTFVADELLGYAGNGIGTTTTFVSLALARIGYDVEVLFAGSAPTASPDPEWQELYDDAGVRVSVVPLSERHVEPPHLARSRDLEAALRASPPDVVVVQDLGAPAYTAIRLRTLGLAFERTAFVVFCHGTRQWITDVSRKVRVLPGAHAVGVLERASVELADAVVSPSSYLVDWMRSEGWKLPERTVVIPHVSRAGATSTRPPQPPEPKPLERIVFFGRLEERKGVRPFAAALNSIETELLRRVEIVFLGRPTPPWPVERVEELLAHETRAAVRRLSFETALDQHEALALLRQPGTLAVIPSFEENSPNVVYECLENRIPFIASHAAGIRELVAPEDHERLLFPPTRDGIAAALRRVLASPEPLRPGRPAFSDARSLRRWQEVLDLPVAGFPPVAPVGVDEAEWLLLRDDADIPEPGLEETLVRAQQVSGADVVTCGVLFDDTLRLFPGQPRGLGLLENGYGTVALIRRSLLEDAPLEPAWPLLARLSAAGADIVSVPLPLVRTDSPPATVGTHPDQARAVLRHFEAILPGSVRLLAELVPRLAVESEPPAAPPRPLVRRLARRLLAR